MKKFHTLSLYDLDMSIYLPLASSPSKWYKRSLADKTLAHFCACFTEYDKDHKDSMTAKETTYDINIMQRCPSESTYSIIQVQEIFQAGIQNKMAF